MDPGQTGFRLQWRVPVPPAHPAPRQTFHTDTGHGNLKIDFIFE